MPSESITRTLQLFGRTVLRWSTEAEAEGFEAVRLEEPDSPSFGFSIPIGEEEDDGDEE